MNRLASMFFASALLATAAAAQPIPIAQSTTDLFDVSRGVVVTGTSGVTGACVIEDIFGATAGGPETGNVFLLDLQPQPFVHWVEWQTPAPVKIGYLNLFAADDGATSRRSFDAARLSYWNGAAWVLVGQYVPTHPYVHQFPQTQLLLQVYLAAIPAASRYRAEFDQYQFIPAEGGFIGAFYGPRIMELDGVPCPADFNGDGVINSADFFAFLSAFFGQIPTGDFNGDGVINSMDFFDFISAFFSGC